MLMPQAIEVSRKAVEEFLTKHAEVSEGRIILLSDGQSTCGEVHPPGAYSRRWDIPVKPQGDRPRIAFLTIGFDVSPRSAAERDLQYLASISGGRYFNAPDIRQLARAFQKFVRVFVPKDLMGPVAQRDALVHFERGRQALLRREYSVALEAFHAFVAAEPEDPAGLYNLAQALEAMDRYKAAAEFYRRYVEVAPLAPDRREVERRIAQLQQDYADHFTYQLQVLRSDLAYLKNYYYALFYRSTGELSREFAGFVSEKAHFYAALPDTLEVTAPWLKTATRDLTDALLILADRVRSPTFDRDAISLLTIPIRQLEQIIERLERIRVPWGESKQAETIAPSQQTGVETSRGVARNLNLKRRERR